MRFSELIRTAFRSLTANKLRAALALLGIIIGVAAVIAVIGIGEGAQRAVQQRIASWATSHVEVYAKWTGRSYAELSPDDAYTLAHEMTLAKTVVPQYFTYTTMKYRGQRTDVPLIGTTPTYAIANRVRIAEGRFFTVGDDDARRQVVVIGAKVARQLGTGTSMIGNLIGIRGYQYQVIGVIDSSIAQEDWGDPGRFVILPLRTLESRAPDAVQRGEIGILAVSEERIPEAAEEVERILRREHRIPFGSPNDFNIANSNDWANAELSTAKEFSVLTMSIAAISLVVGGIGIINIMFVSVAERMQEIGIRKAVGARRRAILAQFLFEAITLCTAGGLLGLAVAVGGTYYIGEKYGWLIIIRPDAVALAVGCAFAVGLLAGILPAIRAARLDPVEALRAE